MSMNGADAADQMVTYALKGSEMILKLSGKGAEKLAIFLLAAFKSTNQTKGRTKLEHILKEGRELVIFPDMPKEKLAAFAKEAKRYGILFHVLKDKTKGTCDILLKSEDAARINRIVERLNLVSVEATAVKTVSGEERQEKNPTKARSAKSRRSEPISTPNEKTAMGTSDQFAAPRPSVRQELKAIRDEQKAQTFEKAMPEKSKTASKKKAKFPKSKEK